MNVKELEARLRLGAPLEGGFSFGAPPGFEREHILERRAGSNGGRFKSLCGIEAYEEVWAHRGGPWPTGPCARCLNRAVLTPWFLKRLLGE